VQLGLGNISCQRYPGDPRTDVELYAHALALAEQAERLGFDAVWTTEHHFMDDSYLPSLLPVCGPDLPICETNFPSRVKRTIWPSLSPFPLTQTRPFAST